MKYGFEDVLERSGLEMTFRDDVSMRQSSGWASWRVRVQVERLGEIAFSMKVFERSDSA